MTELRDWLADLALTQYAAAFEDNHIDMSLVGTLSKDDLREIGVASLGHRKKLLAAARAIADQADETTAQVASQLTVQTSAERDEMDAERRQITVIFCDLVGSTALSERLDPEELSALIKSYRDICAGVVARHEGYVAQYLGDGVMAYFGWPRAHEDDATRAVTAASDIVDGLECLRTNEPLRVRIGVETGAVVVGASDAFDGRAGRLAIGDTPYVASAVQEVAAPGEVIVGPNCHRLLGNAFRGEAIGDQTVRGIVEPLPLYRVVGSDGPVRRFDSTRAATPLVARDTEVAMLVERWRRAADSEGQVVLIGGEAGIGKSRIVQALRDHVRNESHIRLRYQSTENHVFSAFHPLMDFLVRAAGLERDDTPDQKLDKLEAFFVGGAHPPAATTALYAPFLGIPTGERYPALNLSPVQLKAKAIRNICEDLSALARQQPTLMLVEDAQWLDPSSLETITAIIQQIEHERVLLIVTYRPDFKPPWSGYAHVTTLTLNRLNRRQAEDMIAFVAGPRQWSTAVTRAIVGRTDGVPLFIEEVTKAVIGSEARAGPAGAGQTGIALPTDVPASLIALFLARLDKLGKGKELAQIGAVIGRDFSRELLGGLVDGRGYDLDAELTGLVANEVIVGRGRAPHAQFSFRHALLRDAAYQSLLRSKRQVWHGRIAQALQTDFADDVANAPEILAHHLTEAGQLVPAIQAWLDAGRLAAERSAHVEAIGHLQAGRKLLPALADGVPRDTAELGLLLALGPSLLAHRGYTSSEAGEVYGRACELCQKLEDDEHLFPALFGVWVYHWNGGDLHMAHKVAEEFLRRAAAGDNTEALMLSHRGLGLVLVGLGELDKARGHLEDARRLYDREKHKVLRYVYAQDPWVSASGFLAVALVASGARQDALTMVDDVVAYARELDHPFTLAYALFSSSLVKLLAHEPHSGGQHAMAGVELTESEQFPLFHAYLLVFRGAARAAQGDQSGGIADMQQGLAEAEQIGAVVWWPVCLIALARAMSATGQDQQAREAADEALRMAERRGENYALSEVYRLQGDLLAADAADQAEQWYHKALDTADAQGAMGWRLRAATGLARLWRAQGRTDAARELLAPVSAQFADAPGAPDLDAARSLLADL